jgi:cation diffusion facilitator CzcD-associated flavoprotein CzcO
MRIPRDQGPWVHRDGVIDYLEQYARHHRLDLMLSTEVRGLSRAAAGDGWVLETSRGELTAANVVVATGYNNTPFMPEYPGRDEFTGELVHASQYRNAEPYRGRDVLVVGSGNTGAEIAVDLVEGGARRVRLAVRTPPNIVRRQVGGTPNQVMAVALRNFPPKFVDSFVRVAQRVTIGDLTKHGLPKPERGVYTRVIEDDVIPIIDVGLISCVKKGQVEIVGALLGFDGPEVILAAHERIQPEAVIVATGYRRGLEPLVGDLGVLGSNGKPLVNGGRSHPNAPGLYFTGYTNPISGMFRELKIDARRIAKAIARGRPAQGPAAEPTAAAAA